MIYTKNQQEALDYRGGNLLIIACAGSGKTQVLSRRIALLVSEGVPKESIIAVLLPLLLLIWQPGN